MGDLHIQRREGVRGLPGGQLGGKVCPSGNEAARSPIGHRMLEERREGPKCLSRARPRAHTACKGHCSVSTVPAQRGAGFGVLTHSNASSSAGRLPNPPVTFSSAVSLAHFLRSSARGGNFLTNVSLNPPTQTPTSHQDWQKKKKKKIWVLCRREKTLRAFPPYV